MTTTPTSQKLPPWMMVLIGIAGGGATSTALSAPRVVFGPSMEDVQAAIVLHNEEQLDALKEIMEKNNAVLLQQMDLKLDLKLAQDRLSHPSFNLHKQTVSTE